MELSTAKNSNIYTMGLSPLRLWARVKIGFSPSDIWFIGHLSITLKPHIKTQSKVVQITEQILMKTDDPSQGAYQLFPQFSHLKLFYFKWLTSFARLIRLSMRDQLGDQRQRALYSPIFKKHAFDAWPSTFSAHYISRALFFTFWLFF